MPVSPIVVILALTALWFVLYWLVAGVVFAVVGLTRLMRINAARFSCLFSLMSLATAFAAAWTGFVAAERTNNQCLDDFEATYQAIPGLFKCATTIMISNAVLWFMVLLAAGFAIMFVTRLPARSRPLPRA